MNMKTLEITCLNCKGSNKAQIIETGEGEYLIDLNSDHKRNPDDINIISARYRTDMKFGWECKCGNTSIITKSELDNPKIPVIKSGDDAMAILLKSLEVKDVKKFKIVEL